MSEITLYGIKNCDNVKKSRKWLDKNSVEYIYHDFRLDGIEKSLIEEFLKNIEVGLKKIGIKKGDRVTIYLTMIPELAYVMLACARIGAVHSIIFGGFSADSIADRVNNCKSDYIVTADEGIRGGKIIPLKDIVDEALIKCRTIKKCKKF